MADSQVPWGIAALNGAVGEPAWKTRPSWYLVATEDRMIPPAVQRIMAGRAGCTIAEEKGSHSIYVSRPGAVAALVTPRCREPRGRRRGGRNKRLALNRRRNSALARVAAGDARAQPQFANELDRVLTQAWQRRRKGE